MSDDAAFDALLDHLRLTRGFDFSAYKQSSLKRRIDKRMGTVGLTTYESYVDHLEVHPDEFGALFNSILINVTSFFRDAAVWEYVAAEALPALIRAKDGATPIRIWSAACATGEEAYTLAMVLTEALGEQAFKDRVKIYATDADEDALATARQAVYTPRQVEGVPPQHLAKYFTAVNGNYMFSKELRQSVILGRHDLIQDSPISRADLITCRNTLMYFNAEVQQRIVGRFHFGLNDGGLLLVGKAEVLFNHSALFQPLDLKLRLYRVTPKLQRRDRLLIAAQIGHDEPAPPAVLQVGLHEAAFDADPIAQFVVDASGTFVLANDQARHLFGLSSRDIGRPLRDLDLSYRPADIRSAIERAAAGRRPIVMKNVEWSAGPGDAREFDVQVTPLFDQAGAALGYKVSFADITRIRRLKAELQQSRNELETAYEELRSTNEELETTNEELQSTVEELETTNEELQSTNEELETINEELQSTNEELQTMNEEQRTRGGELNELNAFLKSILTSLRAGVVVVDRNLAVQVWNERAEDFWGLRSEEVRGAHLLNLDIGLPVAELKSDIKDILAEADGSRVTVVQATNRRGRGFACRVTSSPLRGGDHTVTGAILIMEDQRDVDGASGSDSSAGDAR